MTDTIILSNQVYCENCGDAPYSAHVHDLASCKCGNVSVDGGMEYLKRLFHADKPKYRDISIEWSREKYKKMAEALTPLYYEDCDDCLTEITRCNISSIVEHYIFSQGLSEDFAPQLTKATEWACRTGRNILGLICALARTERDGDFY